MSKEYKDSKGKDFKIGDIVLNPSFGDLWIVGEYKTTESIKDKEEECPYYLAQYGDIDLYYMDLDEPLGFEILASIGDSNYNESLLEMQKIAEEIKRDEC